MCYVSHYILIFFVILVESIGCGYSESVQCNALSQHPGSAEIILRNADITITNSLLKLCPKNITHLTISASSDRISRTLSWEILSSPKLPWLTELQISVPKLFILSPPSDVNCSSSLLSLKISGCGITELPSIGTFYCLKSLRILNISHNRLQNLPIDLFSYTSNLSNVDVSYNQLTLLPAIFPPTSAIINAEGNPIVCSCLNAWITKLSSFIGLPSCSWPSPCKPELEVRIEVTALNGSDVDFNESSLAVLTGQTASFICKVTSSLPVVTYWSSPIGDFIVPSETVQKSYPYKFQPLLQFTTVHITRMLGQSSMLTIENARGHLSGNWSCSCRSPVSFISSTTRLHVYSSLYRRDVYYISLCYGYGGMLVLLMAGIIGGTIRYCSETHCMRRPQPPFAYEGKTLLGVIPVPEVDSDVLYKHKGVDNIFDTHSDKPVLYDQCSICFNPRTHWFCSSCNCIHFVEEVQEIETDDVPSDISEVPLGELAPDGEIRVVDHRRPRTSTVARSRVNETVDLHRPLMNLNYATTSSHNNRTDAATETHEDLPCPAVDPDVLVRSGNCGLRVRLGSSYVSCARPCKESGLETSANGSLCLRCIHRPGSVDVKLVVSNEKLAEEYREALAGLARAVENPDPAHFRERLEEFRSRLRRDVGHGVKVLRGEFQDLRAKSARGVATLRNQSSAAAQRMRAGLSYGVEQVKDSMRSMAELCGAAGTIGQTISVVSVYTDETDRTKKEKHISAFVF